MARERALGGNVAPWVVDFERRRRPGAELLVEASGELTFDGPAGPFTVTAKADRIELAAVCGHVLDFKTGAPPSKKQVEAGLSPQLTLTAAILNAGGFAKAGVRAPGDLVYVRISGGRTPGEEKACALEGESLDMALAALEGLKRRVSAFDDAETPYVAWAAPQFIDKHGGDYDHLSRLWEWHVIGEGEASEGGE
jgi:ATP-dependent helicase/nuclease subunit B